MLVQSFITEKDLEVRCIAEHDLKRAITLKFSICLVSREENLKILSNTLMVLICSTLLYESQH